MSDDVEDEVEYVLQLFTSLMQRFVDGSISAAIFEKEYIAIRNQYIDDDRCNFVNANSNFSLSKVFTAVDAYCGDDSLRDESDLDEDALRQIVISALHELRSV